MMNRNEHFPSQSFVRQVAESNYGYFLSNLSRLLISENYVWMKTVFNYAVAPLFALCYFLYLRIAYTALEDHESAIECYRKALELDPGNQSYQNNLEIAEQKLQEIAAQVYFKF